MYCHTCGATLSKEDSFCPKCGNLNTEPQSEAEAVQYASTLTTNPTPYDPYNAQPPTFYGSQTTVEGPQNPYTPQTPQTPPPPPPHHRTSSGFLKGLLTSIVLILLIGGGLGGWLLLKQGAHSPSASRSVTPTAVPQSTIQIASKPTVSTTLQSLPGTWTLCALEDATCRFSGTMTVAFGANGSFHYATANNGTACTDAIFGDPLYGTHKACYTEAAPPTTHVWAHCAAENATCSFQGKMTVAFGANGSYKYATQTNGSACTDAIFGDPAYGTVKSCYLISPPTSAATWNTCAAENSTCSFTGTREVAYGADGKYFYGSFTNGTACTNTIFGDPASGTAKTCYYQ